MTQTVAIDEATGLTGQQVADRVARGQINAAPDARSRSLADIFRANTFTWFNGLIGTLWVIMLLVAPIQDSSSASSSSRTPPSE